MKKLSKYKIYNFKKKKLKINIIFNFKYVKNNLFFSIIYKNKIKYLISSGMLGFKGKKKIAYISMEKLIINFNSKWLILKEKIVLKNPNKDINIILILDIYSPIYKIKRPLISTLEDLNLKINKIIIKNVIPHGGCKLSKKRI